MSQTFSPGALRLAGLSARTLGWRPADFWTATPAELAAAITSPDQTSAAISRAEIDALLEREEHE